MVNIFRLITKLVPTKEIKFVSEENFWNREVSEGKMSNRAIADQENGNHSVNQYQPGQAPAFNMEYISIFHSFQINFYFNDFPSIFYIPETLLKSCT